MKHNEEKEFRKNYASGSQEKIPRGPWACHAVGSNGKDESSKTLFSLRSFFYRVYIYSSLVSVNGTIILVLRYMNILL